MPDRRLIAIVLAGGVGSRFRSARPKIVHNLGGKPLLLWVLDAVADAGAAHTVLVVSPMIADEARRIAPAATVAVQAVPRGTGDAAREGLRVAPAGTEVLIATGDTPCLTGAMLRRAVAEHRRQGGGLSVVTATLPDPSGYGRIVRDSAGHLERIVEERDATEAERGIHEINSGIYVVDRAPLSGWLDALRPDNAQGELYLVDIVAEARREGVPTRALPIADAAEVHGVNDRAQWAQAAAILRDRTVARLQAAGVAFLDPRSVWVDDAAEFGRDVLVEANVTIAGACRIADDVQIGTGCVLRAARVGVGAEIRPYTVIEDAEIGAGAVVGPFARLRPGTVLGEGAHVGNFVEIKKTRLGRNSKANHLSYLGDAEIGERVNVGAGTITCNYDGVNKFETVIEDDVFIGSDTQLVAPVRVGARAVVGAGTTVTRDVSPESLLVTRAEAREIPGYYERHVKPRKAKKASRAKGEP